MKNFGVRKIAPLCFEHKNFLFLLTFGLFVSVFANAEPWLANRYANNCVACHAPGRTNVPKWDQRCTVTCMGCHVNPAGGGLRNMYGKWNEERWLYSIRPEGWKLTKNKPAMMEEQPYLSEKVEKYLSTLGSNAPKAKAQLLERGMKMVELPANAEVDEKKMYGRNAQRENIIESDKEKWLLSTPESDPSRETDTRIVIAGGDLRYLRYSNKSNTAGVTTTTNHSVPMAADIGVQVKPTRHVSVVIEARFMNGPSGSDSRSEWDNVFEPISSPSQALGRSAYILIDDIEYNTYLMYGLFRPMFGYNDPDHTNLYNRISYGQNASMKTVVKGVSFGTAENLPFANISLIQPTATTLNQNNGFVANVGFHLGNFGAMVSYWNTKSATTTTVEANRRMLAGGVSWMWGPWIASLDMNRILRDRNDAGSDAGTVFQILNKVKLWRETYLIANYFNANIANDLSLGSSTEMQAGFRSFLITGVDLELLSSTMNNKTATTETTDERLSFQLHLYF